MPMTNCQETWLCHTRAHVRAITFHPHDHRSGLLLTDRHRLHAHLEEAHDVRVDLDDDDNVSALDAAMAALPRFAKLRVLSLQLVGDAIPDEFVTALPCSLRHLTYSSEQTEFP